MKPSKDGHGPNQEERNRMVEAALHGFYKKHGDGPPTQEEQCYMRAKHTMASVNRNIHEVLNTAKAQGHKFDKDSCFQTLEVLIMDAFRQWPKDDLLYLLTILQAGILMNSIEDEVKAGLL